MSNAKLYLVTNFIHVIDNTNKMKCFSSSEIGSYELMGFEKAYNLAYAHKMSIYSILELYELVDLDIYPALISA